MTHPNQTKWEEEYPLNTFHGETKRELVDFITSLLQKQAEEISEAVEGLRKLTGRGTKEREMIYNSALKDVLDLLAIKQVTNK